MHPEDYRTYVIDRNINYTNVCTAKCTFCAFRRDHEDADSYTLSFEQIGEKIRELVSHQRHADSHAGRHERPPADRVVRRSAALHQARISRPCISTPSARRSSSSSSGSSIWTCGEIIRRFHAAGLDTIPGGGGEIFAPRVRRRIGMGKCTGDDWLRVMRVAHEEGMNTSGTMLIGHIEFVRERIEHMAALAGYAGLRAGAWAAMATERRSSDESRCKPAAARRVREIADSPDAPATSAGSYTAFIHWPFQRENTPLGRAKEWDRSDLRPV